MATSISFKLRDPQIKVPPSKQKESPVIMMVNFGYSEKRPDGTLRYIPLKYATGEKIKPMNWNGKRARQVSCFAYENFNTRLDNLESSAKNAVLELLNKNIKPIPDEIKKIIDSGNPRIKSDTPKMQDLNAYIDSFIKDMESGKRLNNDKERYAFSTIKNFKGFKSQFDLYQAETHKKLNYQHITMDFYDEFVEYFVEKNYSPNTIGKHIKNLKTIMRFSRDEGLHENVEIDRKKFKIIRTDVDNIYLNEAELKSMYDLDLIEDKVLEKARDVFLIGCYTAQRFSDYSRIKKENIQLLDNGNKVIRLTQQKTKEPVVIPIKPELAFLLEKYDWNVPKIWEQKLNKHIKTVGEKAGIKDKVLVDKIRGGMKVSSEVPKCDLIKTHTARRSGCTNMYLRGIPTIDIMKLSGHKTEKEFLNYIKVSKDETAASLGSHPYFTDAPMRIAK